MTFISRAIASIPPRHVRHAMTILDYPYSFSEWEVTNAVGTVREYQSNKRRDLNQFDGPLSRGPWMEVPPSRNVAKAIAWGIIFFGTILFWVWFATQVMP